MAYSERTDRLSPSATLAVTEKIKSMIRSGQKAISFGAGEPDFITPEHIREAAIKALRDGHVGSLPTAGLPELKEAIAEKFSEKEGWEKIEPPQVLVSNGSKQSIMNALLALVNKDDEVLIPIPAWVSFPEQAKLADGRPIYVPTSEANGFKLKAEMIKPYITKKTKVLILNNPNNPTGSVMDREDLLEIAELMTRNRIYVISDEIYDHLIYDGKGHVSIASLFPEIRALTITTNGFSKTYAMTGWRVGYAIASKEIIRRMTGIQSHYTSGGNHVAQRAALAALRESQDCVEQMREIYKERRDYLFSRLEKLLGFVCSKPEATFYVYPNITELFGQVSGRQINSSTDLSDLFLEKIQVGVVPGIAFGTEGYVRISYACDMKAIKEGMNRIETLLSEKKN
jgi:aspartate aminotransferase